MDGCMFGGMDRRTNRQINDERTYERTNGLMDGLTVEQIEGRTAVTNDWSKRKYSWTTHASKYLCPHLDTSVLLEQLIAFLCTCLTQQTAGLAFISVLRIAFLVTVDWSACKCIIFCRDRIYARRSLPYLYVDRDLDELLLLPVICHLGDILAKLPVSIVDLLLQKLLINTKITHRPMKKYRVINLPVVISSERWF